MMKTQENYIIIGLLFTAYNTGTQAVYSCNAIVILIKSLNLTPLLYLHDDIMNQNQGANKQTVY